MIWIVWWASMGELCQRLPVMIGESGSIAIRHKDACIYTNHVTYASKCQLAIASTSLSAPPTHLFVRIFMNASTPELYSLPISQRPPSSWRRTFKAAVFFILFNLGCLMVHATQMIILLPIRVLPFKWSKDIYNDGICYTKGAFGCLLSTCFTRRLPLTNKVDDMLGYSSYVPVVCPH